MILPPHRGQTRPRVVRRSTSIPSCTALSSMTNKRDSCAHVILLRLAMAIRDHKYSAKDRYGRHEQNQHADIKVSNKGTVRANRGPAHHALSQGGFADQQE